MLCSVVRKKRKEKSASGKVRASIFLSKMLNSAFSKIFYCNIFILRGIASFQVELKCFLKLKKTLLLFVHNDRAHFSGGFGLRKITTRLLSRIAPYGFIESYEILT